MRRSFIQPVAAMSRINVVPIIDVSLVLVVILLITAPVLTVADMGITLPPAETRGVEDDLRVSVTLGKDGKLAIDKTHVQPAQLGTILRSRIEETRKDVLVVVRADAGVSYESVASVLSQVKEAGAQRIAIATRQGDQILDGGLDNRETEKTTEGQR